MSIAFSGTNGIAAADVGPDENVARRILMRARRLAPCMATWPEELDLRQDAIAILKAVYARATVIGTGAIASQSRNGTSISLRQINSAWTQEDIDDLRSLCGQASAAPAGALPLGSFPTDRPLSKLWPEDRP